MAEARVIFYTGRVVIHFQCFHVNNTAGKKNSERVAVSLAVPRPKHKSGMRLAGLSN